MDLQALQQEHEELQGELRGFTDKAKKAGCEVKHSRRLIWITVCPTRVSFSFVK